MSIKPDNNEQAEVVEHFGTPCKSKMWMKMAFDCHPWEVDHNVITYMRYCYEEAQDEYSSDDVEATVRMKRIYKPSPPISKEEYDKLYKAAFGVSP